MDRALFSATPTRYQSKKTAFAKYLEAVIVHTDLVEKNISPYCCRIGTATWQPSQVSFLKPWDAGILTAIGSISR